MHKKITTKSGLRIITIPLKSTKTITVMVLFGVGSSHEDNKQSGISHFVEHMIYKGTEKRKTPKEVAEFIDSIGAEHNAFTSKEYTGYYVKASSDHLSDAIEFLSDNVSNATLPEKEVSKEKKVILEEIKMYDDLPQEKVKDLFEEAAFSSSDLARTVQGTNESVSSIAKSDIENYKTKHYSYKNSVVVVAGNIATALGGVPPKAGTIVYDKLINTIEEKFKLGEFSSDEDGSVATNDSISIKTLKKDTEQTNIIIGFKFPSSKDEEEKYTARVLAKVLGGSMSSRMFSEIREKRGLAYYVSTSHLAYKNAGLIATKAGIANEKVKEVVEAIILEHIKLFENVSDKELDRAKEGIKGSLNISLEDSSEWAYSFAESEIILNKVKEPEEVLKEIAQVTKDDIINLAKKYFNLDKVVIAAIGPKVDNEELISIVNKAKGAESE